MRMRKAMTGPITSDSMVSFQFRYSSQPNRPTMMSESRTVTVTALVAAEVTCVTSKVSLESKLPVAWSS